MASILDVAKLAGVSPTTAKRALNEPHLLHPATLKRVQDAVNALHYEPDRRAGALRGGHSNAVGLIVGDIVEPFFNETARVMGRELHAAGYSLLVSENSYRSDLELEALRLHYGQRVGAVVLRPGYGPSNLDYLVRMRERGVYVLEIDHHPDDSPFGSVTLDNDAMVLAGVRHLRAAGHDRIAALGTHDPNTLPEGRTRAFERAMAGLGLSVRDAYRHVIPLNEPGAHALTHRLMRLPEPPTALFAINGTGAIGAYRALRELGLRVPDDVSLLTFDDYAWMSLVDPPLDVIAQPVEEMGRAAARLVLWALQDGEGEAAQLRFPGTLIPRGSVAPPRA